jgi:hypothetical protein
MCRRREAGGGAGDGGAPRLRVMKASLTKAAARLPAPASRLPLQRYRTKKNAPAADRGVFEFRRMRNQSFTTSDA